MMKIKEAHVAKTFLLKKKSLALIFRLQDNIRLTCFSGIYILGLLASCL